MNSEKQKINIAALGDTHITETSQGSLQPVLQHINNEADILLLCGDLTNLGLPEEADILIEELSHCQIPVVAVLGNHDFENDKQEEIRRKLLDHKVTVLEGTEYVFEKGEEKIGFTGVKGFGGGFNPNMWGRFGEKEQKAFYDAVASEVEKLEIGLSTLQSREVDHRFVLLHFSPIRATVEGDLIEMYPFLGSSRLEEVIDRYDVTAVFHGHSHFGSPEGTTAKGIPVFNVAMPLMQKVHPDKPYKIFEVKNT
jgi:Icc-related predicted phosphoesterase